MASADSAPSLRLALVIHTHQPVGYSNSVLERFHETRYGPLIRRMEQHPSLRYVVHNSGVLWEWLIRNRASDVERLRSMTSRGQVEILTGGFYAPLLPLIPESDRQDQIAKMTRFIQDRLGQDPAGLWLPEMVWEPHLPQTLVRAGVRYTLLPDTSFRRSSRETRDLLGYFHTEDTGASLAVFPLRGELREAFTRRDGVTIRQCLLNLCEIAGSRPKGSPPACAVFAVEAGSLTGEPGACEEASEEDRLWVLSSLLEELSPRVAMTTLKAHLREASSLGAVYLPSTCERQGGPWPPSPGEALKMQILRDTLAREGLAREGEAFLSGTPWRNFLIRYPEANLLHKRMLQVSGKVRAMRGNPNKAQEDLWKSQCHSAYRVNPTGGLFQTHLRGALYHHLIRAERAADASEHPAPRWAEARALDVDGDGYDEIQVTSDHAALLISTRHGGTLMELDDRNLAMNILDTLARRREVSHSPLLETAEQPRLPSSDFETSHEGDGDTPALVDLLHFDSHCRYTLIDRFLEPGNSLEILQALRQGRQDDLGEFADGPYSARLGADPLLVTLERRAPVRSSQGRCDVTIRKELALHENLVSLSVKYRVTAHGPAPLDCLFAPEFNLAARGGYDHERTFSLDGRFPPDRRLVSQGFHQGLSHVRIDAPPEGVALALSFEGYPDLWRYPVETVSPSPRNLERRLQCLCLIPAWPLSLKPGDTFHTHLGLQVIPLS